MFELYQPRSSFWFITIRSLLTAVGALLIINWIFPGFIEEYSIINHKLFIIILNSAGLILYTKNFAYKYTGNLIVNDDKLKMSHTNTEAEFSQINRIKIIPKQFDLFFRNKVICLLIPKLSNEEYTVFFKKDEVEDFNKAISKINEINKGIVESNFIGRRMFLSKKKAA